jgi:hypothetical protein
LPKGEKILGQKRLEFRQESLSINYPGGKRALNYGALMDELYGGIKFNDVPIFPDTLKREFFGRRLGNIYTFYLANLFDAAAQTFKSADEFNGTSGIYVTDKNAYPNPLQKGELVTLPIQFKNVGNLSISVYSSLGKLVSEKLAQSL